MDNKEKKYGLIPIRKIDEKQIERLKAMHAIYQKTLEENRCEGIYWANIYIGNKFSMEIPEQKQFQEWAQSICMELENGVPQVFHSYGFLQNPKGHKNNQKFHYDYDKTITTVFVPFTYYVYENSTQFLTFQPTCVPQINPRDGAQAFGASQKELLEMEREDCLTICHLVCKPFVLIKMLPGTIHRGISNTSGEDRLVFFISYSPKPVQIAPYYSQFTFVPKKADADEEAKIQPKKD